MKREQIILKIYKAKGGDDYFYHLSPMIHQRMPHHLPTLLDGKRLGGGYIAPSS